MGLLVGSPRMGEPPVYRRESHGPTTITALLDGPNMVFTVSFRLGKVLGSAGWWHRGFRLRMLVIYARDCRPYTEGGWDTYPL